MDMWAVGRNVVSTLQMPVAHLDLQKNQVVRTIRCLRVLPFATVARKMITAEAYEEGLSVTALSNFVRPVVLVVRTDVNCINASFEIILLVMMGGASQLYSL